MVENAEFFSQVQKISGVQKNTSKDKSLLKEAFCPKGGSFQRINGTENMNMFMQDLQTPLEVPRPLPVPFSPTILRDRDLRFLNASEIFLLDPV